MGSKDRKPPRATRQPMPPVELGQIADDDACPLLFLPAPEVRDWMLATFVQAGGPLHNPDHQHLLGADLEVLWAAGGFAKQGRFVVGTMEQVAFRAGGWQKERQEFQMLQWFGRVPKFLMTLDGAYARQASDTEFCALVEHEMYHLGHKLDEFGQPAFDKEGNPKVEIRGHDVEEFVGVVARYGVGNPEGRLAQLVAAANRAPSVSPLRIAQACGTCLLKAA